MKRIVSLLLVSVLLVACMAGCGGKTETPATTPVEGGASAALPGEGEVYCVIAALNQLEFFDALKAGVNDAANGIGAKWYISGPTEFIPDQIVQAIDQAVANGVTGIVLHGQAEETADAVNNAIDAGVPVICVNTDIPSKRLSFIGCNPYNAGVDMANEMITRLDGKKGSVIISSAFSAGQPSALANYDGAKETLEAAGYKVIQVDDLPDSNTAATNISASLQANADVVGIIGQQAYTAVGAATAVREAGKTGEIIVIGRDRDAATLELIEKGEVTASYAQNSYVEAFIALQWLHAYTNGNLKAINNYLDVGMNPLPKVVDSGSIVITQENAAQFREKYVYEVTAKN